MTSATTRRSFLSAAGVAGLSAVVSVPASARVEETPWGIKLGVATYSLRKFDRTKAIAMLKELQVTWISIKDVDTHLSHKSTPEELRQARAEFDAAGFKVMSCGNVDMTKATTTEALRPLFEFAKNAGMPMMVCAPTHQNIKLVEALVKEYNIKIAIHNHGPEDKHFPTPQSVLEVVRDLDPRCGLCMDIGHSARAGVDLVKAIDAAGSRLLDMHVKDLTGLPQKPVQVDVGDGDLPFPQVFQHLKKMNYQGCVNLEYEIHDTDPMPGMQRSMSYMRGVLAGLAAA